MGTTQVEHQKAGGREHRELSLIIPAWNERDSIDTALREAIVALSSLTTDFEIIVVDDGSTDDTAERVLAAAKLDERVRLVRHPCNRGYGASLRSGFTAARFAHVAYTDADCQFELADLGYMLKLAENYDVTCGYRINRQDPALRRFLSWGYNTLAGALLGSTVRDIDCALKVFSRKKLLSVLPNSDGFFANTELLTRARAEELSIIEVGVRHRPRHAGHSKISWRDVPRTLAAMLPFWWTSVLFGQPRAAKPAVTRHHGPAICLVLLITAALLFGNLGYPLLEPDEGRYAEIGREMLASGNWVVPTLNDLPYLDKPPLFYWLLALSYQAFGATEQSARLVPASAAFLTVCATYFFGRRILGPQAALLGAGALALMGGFVHCGRFLILDGVLTLFVSLALFCAYEATRGPRLRWRWWVASALACGAGVLTKGPVAFVLVAPPVIASAWLTRSDGRARIRDWGMYLGVMAGLVVPWFTAICLQRPEFMRQFLLDHHLRRFFSQDYHPGPFWFYVPVLLLGCFPWTLLLFPMGRSLLVRSQSLRECRPTSLGFLLLWSAWCVLFFSVSRGKLPTYVMPALPPIALVLGWYLELLLARVKSASELGIQGAFAYVPQQTTIALCGTWLVLNAIAFGKQVRTPFGLAMEVVGFVGCTTLLIAVLIYGRRMPLRPAWALCALAAVPVLYEGAQEFVPAWSQNHSLLNQPGVVANWLGDDDVAVACYGDAPPGSVPFALQRDNVRCFDDESGVALREFLVAHPRALLVVRRTVDLEVARRLVPMGEKVTQLGPSRKAHFLLVEPSECRMAADPTLRR